MCTWYKNFRRGKKQWQKRKYMMLFYPCPSLLLNQNVAIFSYLQINYCFFNLKGLNSLCKLIIWHFLPGFFFAGVSINRLWRKPILKVYCYIYNVSLFLFKMFNRAPSISECPKHGNTHTIFIDLHFLSQIAVGFLMFPSNRLHHCCLKHNI